MKYEICPKWNCFLQSGFRFVMMIRQKVDVMCQSHNDDDGGGDDDQEDDDDGDGDHNYQSLLIMTRQNQRIVGFFLSDSKT